MTYDQLLAAYRATGKDVGTPEQNDAFNAWTRTLPGGQDGDWGSITSTAAPVAPVATAPTGGTGGVAGATDTGINLGALVQAGTQPAIQVPSITNPAVAPSGAQGYSQNQVGGQTGGYTSVGGSTSQQSGSQNTNTTQNQTGTQSNTGTQTNTGVQSTNGSQTSTGTQNNTGTQNSTGTSTSTTGVNAPFDIGALVNSQLGTAGAADTQRSAFLNDVMATGGTQFGSQVDQAVRNSLTGPQMTGTGDSARARAAGYAGAQVGRNNLDQRLGAAQQLGNANSNVNSTLGATTPLMGQTTSGTSTNSAATSNLINSANTALNNSSTNSSNATDSANTGTSSGSTTGSSNQMNLQNLVSNEGQAGTATGASMQQGFGITPAGQAQKSGGCVVCTAYVARKEMKPGAVRAACRYKQANWARYGTSLSGYLLLGPWLAQAVLKSNRFAQAFRPTARAILYHEVYLSAPTRLKWRLLPAFQHAIFDTIFYPVGLAMRLLSVAPGVRCQRTKALLVSQNLSFYL